MIASRALLLAASLLFAPALVACSSSPSGTEGPPDTDGGSATSHDGGATADGAAHPADAGTSTDSGTHVTSDAAAPGDFWDAGTIPPAQNVMTYVFLNRTNGKYADGEVYWSFKSGSVNETHSIAAMPTYDMPANSSGRLYFYLCAAGDSTCAADPTKSKYFDFIEHTIGATQFNGNTTRVDAFGVKVAMRLHCADGYDQAVGEDYATFAEDRAVTFQAFLDAAPTEFKPLAEAPYAPYRIVNPGTLAAFQTGAQATYYDSYVDQIWSANGITVAKPGPNGSGLGSYPDLSAAIYRHVGGVAGTFGADGKLLNKGLWSDPATFYTAPPANYYAAFWHTRALGGKAYGFPYDDVGGYSSYLSHANPQYLLAAIGW